MLPARWSHPPWRNIDTNTDASQLLPGQVCSRKSWSPAASLSPAPNDSAIARRASSPPSARVVWFVSSNGICALQKKNSCCSAWPANVGSHSKKIATLAAMSTSVSHAVRLVGLMSRMGITWDVDPNRSRPDERKSRRGESNP